MEKYRKIICQVLVYVAGVALLVTSMIVVAVWATSEENWNAGESAYTVDMKLEYARALDRQEGLK